MSKIPLLIETCHCPPLGGLYNRTMCLPLLGEAGPRTMARQSAKAGYRFHVFGT